MKIEMGESLCYSYLRHVQKCWLVQANWKASEHWESRLSSEELEEMFRSMRQNFDLGGSVFKGTKDSAQFLKQGEIDVVGVGQDGRVHAIDVAFHEAGLNYGGGVGNRVLKKLLRTLLILRAYHPGEVSKSIYFISPKVHPASQQPLEDIFSKLRREYPAEDWHLFTNESFSEQVMRPTLRAADKVADTSELFVRSAKLLELGRVETVEASISLANIATSQTPNGQGSQQTLKANGRKNHQEHVQNCIGALTLSGYSISESVSGHDGADFSIQREGQEFPVDVRVASRVEILKKNVGKALYVSFETNGSWYLLPHDNLVSIAGKTTPWLESDSWSKKGWYSTAKPSQSLLVALKDFAL